MSQTHDQNFKNLILDYPIQAIQFFAPQESSLADEELRVIPLRQEQLKEKLGDRYRELDTPIMIEWPNSNKKAIIFLMEEESISSRFSIIRLAHYCLDISELYQSERIIPVVIFLKGGQYRQQLSLGSETHIFLDFHFINCDLSALMASQYLESDNIVARLNLPLMCYNKEQKVAIYAQAINGLMSIEKSITQQVKYIDFIDHYTELSPEEQKDYQLNYLQQNSEGELSMGHAQLLRDEGLQQGMQQGVQQGEAILLLRQMKQKFGAIPVIVQQKLEQASTDELLLWAENILVAKCIEDVFK